MNDYSDILFLMAAMMILSLLTASMAKVYVVTQQEFVRSELEYRVIATVQDQIDEIRWEENPTAFDSTHGDYRFDSYPVSKEIRFGPGNRYVDQVKIDASAVQVEDSDTMSRYKVTVTVTNDYLRPEVTATLSYTKSYQNE